MLTRLLLFIIGVCLLRSSPADAPRHPYAAAIAVLLHFILLLWIYARESQVPAVFPALQISLIVLLGVRGLLQLHRHAERFNQVVFSLFTTSIAMTLVIECSLLPLQGMSEESPLYLLFALGSLLLWFWSFMIDAHIFRRSLDSSFAHGMLLAVLLFTINYILLSQWYVPLLDDTGA